MSNRKLKAIFLQFEEPITKESTVVNMTDLDEEDYEGFLEHMEKLRILYYTIKNSRGNS